MPLLSTSGLSVQFGALKAVDGVDLELRSGEILGLIGPNGAGKTTLVNAITGFQTLAAGTVQALGTEITGWPPYRLARKGIARTFQGARLFADLTVLENVEVAALTGTGNRRSAPAVLARLGLAHRSGELARSLPHGDQRLLGIARALATRPRVLVMDEPAAGLNEEEGEHLLIALERIVAEDDCSLLVIEHDMPLVMRLCTRIHVLDHGRTICVGSPDQVRSEPAVIEAYLGVKRAHEHARG